MPRVIVEWLEGRSEIVRDKLALEITEAFVNTLKVKPEQISILFRENSPEKQYKGGKRFKALI